MRLIRGFNNRCSICDMVDTIAIASYEGQYRPGLSFYAEETTGQITCQECLRVINETILEDSEIEEGEVENLLELDLDEFELESFEKDVDDDTS